MDPRPFTLRELKWMARGAGMQVWEPSSEILCLLANINRDTKKRRAPFKPSEFNRYSEE